MIKKVDSEKPVFFRRNESSKNNSAFILDFMKKKRLNLNALEVTSFVTSVSDKSVNTVKGGVSALCVTVNGCGIWTNPGVSCTGCQTVAGVDTNCGGGGGPTQPPLPDAPNEGITLNNVFC